MQNNQIHDTVLITGCAGFIGFHVAYQSLKQGHHVIGLDNLNTYYDVSLKQARLEQLEKFPHFTFHHIDIADRQGIEALQTQFADVTKVIHLAAQAGVRYSLKEPFDYAHSNLTGQLVMLEMCRSLPKLEHFIFASSSSVYGNNEKKPFAVEDACEKPISFYAATKLSGEYMTKTYAHLYGIPSTCLRFFTVYGPWGRPDMAIFMFTKSILAGNPIQVFNQGQLQRDYTYIDDIVSGVLLAKDCIPQNEDGHASYACYNLGNHQTVELMHFIRVLESSIGKKAVLEMLPKQPGDVDATYADISTTHQKLGYSPSTSIEQGVNSFVEWYKQYYH